MASIFDNSSSKKSILGNSNQVSPVLGGPAISSVPKGQQPQQGPAVSGAYNNLSNYLNANKNNNLANRLVNQTQKQASQLGDDLKAATGQFKSDSDTSIAGNDSAKNQVVGAVDNISSGQVSPANQGDAFKVAASGQYNGPTALNGQSSLQSGVQNLGNMANNVNTESGRFSLLRQLMGRQGYNSGQQKLDQALLQGNQQQLAGLNAIKSQANQTANDFNSATGQVANTVYNNTQKAQQIAQQAKDKIGEGRSKVLGLIQKNNDDVTSNQFFKDIQSGKITADEVNKILGVPGTFSGIDAKSLYGIKDLKNYYSPSSGNTPGLADTIDQSNVAKLAALQKLAGQGSDPELDKLVTQYSKAGTFDPSKLFDAKGLKATVDARKNEYQNKLQDIVKDPETQKYLQDKAALDWVTNAINSGKDLNGSWTALNQKFGNLDNVSAALAGLKLAEGTSDAQAMMALQSRLMNDIGDVGEAGHVARINKALNQLGTDYSQDLMNIATLDNPYATNGATQWKYVPPTSPIMPPKATPQPPPQDNPIDKGTKEIDPGDGTGRATIGSGKKSPPLQPTPPPVNVPLPGGMPAELNSAYTFFKSHPEVLNNGQAMQGNMLAFGISPGSEKYYNLMNYLNGGSQG